MILAPITSVSATTRTVAVVTPMCLNPTTADLLMDHLFRNPDILAKEQVIFPNYQPMTAAEYLENIWLFPQNAAMFLSEEILPPFTYGFKYDSDATLLHRFTLLFLANNASVVTTISIGADKIHYQYIRVLDVRHIDE